MYGIEQKSGMLSVTFTFKSFFLESRLLKGKNISSYEVTAMIQMRDNSDLNQDDGSRQVDK